MSQTPGRFDEVYGAHGSDAIRWVRPPFIDERLKFIRDPKHEHPSGLMIALRDGKPNCELWMYGQFRVLDLIAHFLNFYQQEIEGDILLAKTPIPGDFVINLNSDLDQYRAALEKVISQLAETQVTLTLRNVERSVIVFTGAWQATNPIKIYGANPNDPAIGCSDNSGSRCAPNRGDLDHFAKSVGQWIERTVIVEASQTPGEIAWRFHHLRQGNRETARLCRNPALVCSHIQEQTGLKWKEETRRVIRLFLERASSNPDCETKIL